MNRVAFPAAALCGLAFIGAAHARPFPDRLGVCYVFAADQLRVRTPCVISAGYGAGAQYLTLSFEKQVYDAEFPNSRPDMAPTLKGKAALSYRRDASFLAKLKGKPIEGEDYLECLKTKDGQVDLCWFEPAQ